MLGVTYGARGARIVDLIPDAPLVAPPYGNPEKAIRNYVGYHVSVSYTHLTLPTICSV